MGEYHRLFVKGGTYFFTVVTYDRQPLLCEEPALMSGFACMHFQDPSLQKWIGKNILPANYRHHLRHEDYCYIPGAYSWFEITL